MAWGEDRFFAAFKRAGMLLRAHAVMPGTNEAIDFDVDYCEPSTDPMTGVQSTDYEIEYQHADVPDLDEGAQVIIDGKGLFLVRQAPRTPGPEGTGFFRKALLTKVRECP